MSIEAMMMALEALTDGDHWEKQEAITALRQAIEQAEKQEPDKYVMDIECTKCGAKQSGILTVNTTPPQRHDAPAKAVEWVDLTDDEEMNIALEQNKSRHWVVCEAIRQFKEKNT